MFTEDDTIAVRQAFVASGENNVAIGHYANVNLFDGRNQTAIGWSPSEPTSISIGQNRPYDAIHIGNIDVLNLVKRLETLEETVRQQDAELARLKCNPVLVDFDELATAMAETASDETVFVNPPETGSTIELKRR